jgi:GAF domain-containing protein
MRAWLLLIATSPSLHESLATLRLTCLDILDRINYHVVLANFSCPFDRRLTAPLRMQRERSRRSRRRRKPAALERLRIIASIRPEFARLRSVSEITERGAKLALEHAGSQAASVFLCDQLGRLVRVALVGNEKGGASLGRDSMPPEHHYPGDNFTGKAVVPIADSSFGQAQWSNSLAETGEIAPLMREIYVKALGDLSAAVSVPLNGSHRSFGVLEVINKLAGSSFNVEDVHWLSLIANELALSLSDQRRRLRSEILHSVAEAVVSILDSTMEEVGVYGRVAEALTSHPLPYRVCIIRLRTDLGLSTAAAASGEVSLLGRDDSPLPLDHGLAGSVFKTGQPVYVMNIKDRDPVSDGLRNWRWAIDSGLVSYTCLPLIVEERVVGTFSLYFGFVYTIDDDEWSFLKTLARSLAAFWNGRRLLQELRESSFEDAGDAVMARYDSELVPSRHDMRDFLSNLQEAVKVLEGKNLGASAGQRDYERVCDMIADKYEKIKKEFSVADPEIVDLNELIKTVVAQKRKVPLEVFVDFHLRLDRRVPPLVARTSALRYVIKDLVINAIKTIQRKGEGYGVVVIETKVVKEKSGLEQVELTVSDTGEGIARELWDKVFDAGYTSYEGGTGLGLNLARGVLSSSYGGRIEIASSTVGEGSIFRVLIPTWNSA